MARVHVAPSATANGKPEVYGAPPLSVVSSEQLRLQLISAGQPPLVQVIAEEIVGAAGLGESGGGGDGDGGGGLGDGGDGAGGGGDGDGGGGLGDGGDGAGGGGDGDGGDGDNIGEHVPTQPLARQAFASPPAAPMRHAMRPLKSVSAAGSSAVG